MFRISLRLCLLAFCMFFFGCIELSASPTPTSTFGQVVTFTATPANGPGGPPQAGDVVTFTDDVAPIAGCTSVAANGSGNYVCSTSTLALGPHTIRAKVDTAPSDFAATVSHRVIPAIALTSSKNPSAAAESVTFTATANATPATGTVTFVDDLTTLCLDVVGVNGVYTCTTSSLTTVGDHPITATYTEGEDQTTATLTQKIGPAVVLTSSKNPSAPNEPVTFTATTNGGEATVTFTDGETVICANVSSATGVYNCTTSALKLGDHVITATRSGKASFSATLTQVIKVTTVNVSVSSSKNPSITGESVTFTAQLDTVGGPLAGGTGTFRDVFGGGAVVLGTVPVGSGLASIAAPSLATGQHTIEFIYNGDANYPPGASASTGQTVTAASSNLSLSSSPNPSVVGQAVTLTAVLTTSGTSTPRGTVTFADGSVFLGDAPVSNGLATLTTTVLTLGTHSLTATYAGDPNAVSSTASATHVVGKSTAVLQLGQSAATTTRGQNVIFRAQVRSTTGSGAATGTVRFNTANASLGSATLDGSGIASFSTSSLSPGRHEITATYDGDTRLTGSTATIVHTVTSVSATVTVASSPNPSRAGEAVTITATLTATVGTPQGSVSFRAGDAVIGTAPIDFAGVATFTTTTLPVGTSDLAVDYDGGGFYPSGTGTAVHVVGKANTAIQLASAPNPSAPGGAVTFNATITANAPIPITGSVEIFDNATSVGVFPIVNTSASFTTSALTRGVHTIRVAYPGNNQLNGSETSIVHTVEGTTGANPADPGAPPGSPGIGTGSPSIQVGSSDDDGGCSVATPGTSSSPRALFLFALAGLLAVRRRRR